GNTRVDCDWSSDVCSSDLGTNTVRLQANAGNVTQVSTGVITAGALGVRAAGGTNQIDLGQASNVVSNTGNVAMSAAGNISFKDTAATGYNLGQVAADGNFTVANGLSSGNTITLNTTQGTVTQSATNGNVSA